MEFLSQQSVWLYIFIFFGKIATSVLGVLWLVLLNRGEKLRAALVSIFEVSLWILIAGTVLIGFQDDLIKVAVYAVGTAIGFYFGAMLEERIALGVSSIQVIVAQDNVAHTNAAQELAAKLRSADFAVTLTSGKGRQCKRDVLLLHLKRKRIKRALDLIREDLKSAMITVSDIKMIKGGYIKK